MGKLWYLWYLSVWTLLSDLHLCVAAAAFDIEFVSTNPIFGDGLHVFKKEVRISDRIRFFCSADGEEQTVIYRVDEKSAMSCHIPPSLKDSIVGSCQNANDSVIIRLRENPVLPKELAYAPNQDYYFITTSDGTPNGLLGLEGGLCQTHNMRIQVHVKPYAGSSKTTASKTTAKLRAYEQPNDPTSEANLPVAGNSSKKWMMPQMVPFVYVPQYGGFFPQKLLPEHIGNAEPSNNGDSRTEEYPFRPYPLFIPGNLQAQLDVAVPQDIERKFPALFYPAQPVASSISNPQNHADGKLETVASKFQHGRFEAADDPEKKHFASPLPDSHFSASRSEHGALVNTPDVKDFEIEYIDQFAGGTAIRFSFSSNVLIVCCSAVIMVLFR